MILDNVIQQIGINKIVFVNCLITCGKYFFQIGYRQIFSISAALFKALLIISIPLSAIHLLPEI